MTHVLSRQECHPLLEKAGQQLILKSQIDSSCPSNLPKMICSKASDQTWHNDCIMSGRTRRICRSHTYSEQLCPKFLRHPKTGSVRFDPHFPRGLSPPLQLAWRSANRCTLLGLMMA